MVVLQVLAKLSASLQTMIISGKSSHALSYSFWYQKCNFRVASIVGGLFRRSSYATRLHDCRRTLHAAMPAGDPLA